MARLPTLPHPSARGGLAVGFLKVLKFIWLTNKYNVIDYARIKKLRD